MIRKFFVYCSSDGFESAFRMALRSFYSRFAYKSVTAFYEIKNVGLKAKAIDGFELRLLSLPEVEALDFPRLKMSNYRKWFSEGGKVYVGFYRGIPVSFTWTHFERCHFDGLGDFLMNSSECWVGPTFVHKKYRGLGLNKYQLLYQIQQENVPICYGSANEGNLASIRSIEKIGFTRIGKVSVSFLLGKRKINIEGLEEGRIKVE